MALHNYHATLRCFPSGYIDKNINPSSTPDNDLGPSWGWAALLLPFVEEQNVYSQIDFSQGPVQRATRRSLKRRYRSTSVRPIRNRNRFPSTTRR